MRNLRSGDEVGKEYGPGTDWRGRAQESVPIEAHALQNLEWNPIFLISSFLCCQPILVKSTGKVCLTPF